MLTFCISFVIILLISISILYFRQKSIKCIKGKHILITGGSSGIGLCLAIEALKCGANVSILARNQQRLLDAEKKLKLVNGKIPPGERGKFQSFSCDVSKLDENFSKVVDSVEELFGPIYMLINCAGYSLSGNFEELPKAAVKQMMDVNYYGSFFLTQAVVKNMKQRVSSGSIVFVSSQAGLFGLFGYTAYSASKSAVVKLAEALHMELKPSNITVTVALPPDTDTPGFNEENLTKPTETRLISESAGLFQPDVVAKSILNDALEGKFYSSNGMEGFMMTVLCAGMSPITNMAQLFQEVFLSGLFRSIASFYLWNFDSIVKREYGKRLRSKKQH